MSSFTTWVKKHPLTAFCLLAFALTWLGWAPQALYSRGLFPFDSLVFYVIAWAGPLLAVYVVVRILRGQEDLSEIFGPLAWWHENPLWYAAALLGYPLMWLASIAMGGVWGQELANLPAPFSLAASFVMCLAAAIPQEIAWRGFVLPRLQARHSALVAGLIVGALYGLWQLPLLLNLNNPMSAYPIDLYILEVTGRSLIYVWLFNNTRGSLLFVTLFHAVSIVFGSFIGYENLTVTYIAVGILIILYGPEDLTRRGDRVLQVDEPAGGRIE